MRRNLKLLVLAALVFIGSIAANASANACWFFAFYQPKCPESLIKHD